MVTEGRRRERLDRGIRVRTEGVYALSSWREILYLLGPRSVLIVGLLAAPLAAPGMYWQRIICIMCIFALLALLFDFSQCTTKSIFKAITLLFYPEITRQL